MSAAAEPSPVLHRAVIVLGSNLQPEQHLPAGVARLNQLDGLCRILRVSQVWQSPAVGTQAPDFLNAAVLVATPLNPAELKQHNRMIEAAAGRVRSADKFAPRTLDLDIVIYDDQPLDAELFRWAHLAVPVSEITPNFQPTGQSLPLRQAAESLYVGSGLRLRPDVHLTFTG